MPSDPLASPEGTSRSASKAVWACGSGLVPRQEEDVAGKALGRASLWRVSSPARVVADAPAPSTAGLRFVEALRTATHGLLDPAARFSSSAVAEAWDEFRAAFAFEVWMETLEKQRPEAPKVGHLSSFGQRLAWWLDQLGLPGIDHVWVGRPPLPTAKPAAWIQIQRSGANNLSVFVRWLPASTASNNSHDFKEGLEEIFCSEAFPPSGYEHLVLVQSLRALRQWYENHLRAFASAAQDSRHSREARLEQALRFLFSTCRPDTLEAHRLDRWVWEELGFSPLTFLWGDPRAAFRDPGGWQSPIPFGFRPVPADERSGGVPARLISTRTGSELALVNVEELGTPSIPGGQRIMHFPSRPYVGVYLALHEVSVLQYVRFGLLEDKDPKELARRLASAPDPNAPVTQVSWFEAMEYAQWAGGTLPPATCWQQAAAQSRSLEHTGPRAACPNDSWGWRLSTVYALRDLSAPSACINLPSNVSEWCLDATLETGSIRSELEPMGRVAFRTRWMVGLIRESPPSFQRVVLSPWTRQEALGFRLAALIPAEAMPRGAHFLARPGAVR